jgi:alpha-D-xyloside xylohydrolase
VPWLFDEESVDVLRSFTHLKYRLMPYLFGAARQAHDEGLPVMRPMVVGFPDDPAAVHLDRQYLLGGDLLVAPVFSADGEVGYYVPAGRWTRFGTDEVVEGPGWVRERHGFDSVPLLVRPGAVLPIGNRVDRPDYDYRDGVTLRVHEPAEGVTVVRVGESTFTVTRDGTALLVERSGAGLPWRVEVVGGDAADLTATDDECRLSV